MSKVHSVALATDADADEIAGLRNATADRLTRDHGVGHWSSSVTAAGVLRGITTSRVLVARGGAAHETIVGTLRLARKKPWAIDPTYFAAVPHPIYLLDMAVVPDLQRQGIGRQLCEYAKEVARAWPSGGVRLDAYDHAAGAGDFYKKCGFREVGRITYRKVPLIYFEHVF